MDELTRVPQEPGSLQFDSAESAAGQAAGFACAFCATPLQSYYFEIGGKPACEGCRYRLEEQLGAPPGLRGFLRAAGAGAAAAAAGCGLYYAVRELTGYEIGLVAIVVGFMVGGAVRWGTRRKGGRAYQLLAVALTYMAIACTYLPVILKSIGEQMEKDNKAPVAQPAGSVAQPAAVSASAAKPGPEEEISAGQVVLAVVLLFVMAAAAPIVAGFESPILLLIVGFGLWEAWKMNRRAVVSITGPLQIGAAAG